MNTTTIRDPDGKQWEIHLRNDAIVHAVINGADLTVDNTGAPTIWEKLSQLYMMRWLTEDTKESD